MNQEGQRGMKMLEQKERKLRGGHEAGQGWGQGEWEWSKAARHQVSKFFYVITHSTRHCFYLQLEHAGPQEAAIRSLNRYQQSLWTSTEVMLPCLSWVYSPPAECRLASFGLYGKLPSSKCLQRSSVSIQITHTHTHLVVQWPFEWQNEAWSQQTVNVKEGGS